MDTKKFLQIAVVIMTIVGLVAVAAPAHTAQAQGRYEAEIKIKGENCVSFYTTVRLNGAWIRAEKFNSNEATLGINLPATGGEVRVSIEGKDRGGVSYLDYVYSKANPGREVLVKNISCAPSFTPAPLYTPEPSAPSPAGPSSPSPSRTPCRWWQWWCK